MEKNFGDYYVGLDLGTDSLGWAVTDLEYNIPKVKGKALWGVRLFESGKTAAERRIFRSSRRRLQRKVQRKKLLQELFAPEIAKVDFGFFQRLDDSKFWQEDKQVNQPYALFADSTFTDKEYYKEYKTIYHLRKALIDDEKKAFDIRLLYLAIHHIIKHRGHFLFYGQSLDSINNFKDVFESLQSYLNDEFGIDFDCGGIESLEKSLKDRRKTITDKKKELEAIFNVDSKDKQKKSIIALMAGGTVNLSDLFLDDSLKETAITKICFSTAKFDDERDNLADILGEKMYCVEKIKAIYDWTVLSEILNGKTYLSDAKVEVYKEHERDLKALKLLMKKYCTAEEYKKFFSESDVEDNYPAYIGMCKKGNKKIPLTAKKRCSQEEICKRVEKMFEKEKDSSDVSLQTILAKARSFTLLPKQVSKDNGVIPFQVHKTELVKILDNAEKYFPFLNQKDESGFSVKEKILKIFEFRIPYYVGPLNDAHKGKGSNCWIVKKTNEKIRPWNFEEVVDVDKSAEAFIRRMTNKCTYLIGEDVLPKDSLLYSEYMVLNELNNLKINGEKISVELKQRIFSELFMVYKKITAKKLRVYLTEVAGLSEGDEISGIDGDFKTGLASYIDFKKILSEKLKNREMVEELIKWCVLFGDDKKLLSKRIEKVYGDLLSEDEKKKICFLKYSGWGRFSEKFLTEIFHVDKSTGECLNIINAMRESNNNLQQLLSADFDYIKAIDKFNNDGIDENEGISYQTVENLYVSPAVKRSIWQTLTVVREIQKIMKKQPKKVFVEVARDIDNPNSEKKKPTSSRKAALLEFYKNCRDDSRNWADEIGQRTEGELRRDSLYLYYTQMGKCMYSGENIDLQDLFNNNKYDIDHIYPQSKIKDDSIENRVLVKKEINSKKSDKYPLPKDIRDSQRAFWNELYNKKFISKKKYDRLTRSEGFSEGELSDFIARQLVETRQSTKAVAEILKKVFNQSEIVYVKAGNVSEFRQKYELIKVREVNDYHHAKDAYLNIVVGNVYNTKFTHDPRNFFKKGSEIPVYSLNCMYRYDIERNGIVAWKASDNDGVGTIAQVKKIMGKNNILFTRYAYAAKGGFFKQQILKKGNGQLPIKGDKRLADISKYGGYNEVSGSYAMLLEHTVKGKRVRSIEYVLGIDALRFSTDEEALLRYVKENFVEPQILLKKIKKNTLFKVDGFLMHLSGRTGNSLIFKGANQLCLDEATMAYLKKVLKFVGRMTESRGNLRVTSFDGILPEENLKVYDLFLDKLKKSVYGKKLSAQVQTFVDGREKFMSLSSEEQCKLLNEALHLFQCNPVDANLELIDGKKRVGSLTISKNIPAKGNIKIIYQSPTGIFEQEVDLMKL